MTTDPCREAIEAYVKAIAGSDARIMVFDEIVSLDFHLDVYWIKASEEMPFHMLITCGVSSIPMNVPSPELSPFLELFILLPSDWNMDELKKEENYWPILLLKSLGRFPHAHQTWLGFGHTVPEGAGKVLPGTEYIASFLTKSRMLAEEFQRIPGEPYSIELLMPFPLYNDEYQFKKEHGTRALLEVLDNSEINDLARTARPGLLKK